MKIKLLSILFTFLYIAPLHAYIDPGSGGAIVTAILGFIAAIGYTIRKYFYKLKKFFLRNK